MFERQCPDCNVVTAYKRKGALTKAIKENRRCLSCARKNAVFSDSHRLNLAIAAANVSEETKAKRRAKNLGRKNTDDTRKLMSINRGGNGELNNKFPGWSSWRKRALERIHFCEWCFSEDRLEVHHVIPKAKFPQYHDADWNARVMCYSCHKTCHKQGGY